MKILEFGVKKNIFKDLEKEIPGLKIKSKKHISDIRNKPISELTKLEKKILN